MTPEAAERRQILSYAAPDRRAGLAALLALDDALAALLRTTREPALGQIRLQWWRDRLSGLDDAPPPAEPVLQGLAEHVLPRGVAGSALAEMVAGWDVLIEADLLDAAALRTHGNGRGGALFAAAAAVLGGAPDDPVEAAGTGWALADLGRHLQRSGEAEAARALAAPMLATATAAQWSRNGRALGALVHLARRDLALPPGAPPPVGAPLRVGRLIWHRFTGR